MHYVEDAVGDLNPSIALQLQAGQEVYLRPYELRRMYGADDYSGMSTWFSGYLVYPL